MGRAVLWSVVWVLGFVVVCAARDHLMREHTRFLL